MDSLPFELVIAVSSSDPVAFARMICASKKVYQYVNTIAGRNRFLATCANTTVLDRKSTTISLITGKKHSFYDQPAVINKKGAKIWYQNGKRHRDDGPAVVRANGDQIWYQHGNYHHDDGPAVLLANGYREWYQHDKRHRIDGPAVILANGDQWWLNGKRHCDNGPAIVRANGYREWWLNGIKQAMPI